MSPLWNSARLRVYVGADHLALCRVSGRRAPRVTTAATLTVASPAPADVIAALEAWLAAQPAAALRGVALDVVLGASQVRFLALPWDRRLVQPALREALARSLFSRHFQEAAEAWDFRFGPARYGQPQLAVGLPRELRAGLVALVARHGLRLGRMEPLLAAVHQRFAAQLPRRGEATLLVAEDNRLLRAALREGVVVDVQLRPCDGADLAALVQRETVPARLFAPLQPGLAGLLPAAWLTPNVPAGLLPAETGGQAFALCGGR